MRVYLSTNGCTEAQLSSTHMEKFLRMNNIAIVDNPSQAEIVLFLACGLTNRSEKDSLALIRRLQKEFKPGTKLIVWGCLPRINPESLLGIYSGPFEVSTDTSFLNEIPETRNVPFSSSDIACAEDLLLSTQTAGLNQANNADFLTSFLILLKQTWDRLWARSRKNTNYWIRIAEGCTGHCTYCSERLVFGNVRSRPIEKIISDVELGLKQGYNTISLVATDLGAYGRDMGFTLVDLLKEIVSIDSEKRFKIVLNQLSLFYLMEMFSDLREIFASGRISVIGCPVQSGSNRILKLMGRLYTAEEWRECMIRINREFPRIRLVTHIMVGFPTETDEDFASTLRLLDFPLFLDSFGLFRFSPRSKVPAWRMKGQVSEKTKELRSKKFSKKYIRMYVLNSPIRWFRVFLRA
jgi:threonylcarbamoyladenosine tRNA methylthiotransferase CDKAL1